MSLADLTRHAVDLLPAGGLEEKLKLGRPLRVKLGVDPTSPDVHLGFALRARAAGRLPARGPPGRPDRRRLHGPDRRPVGALEGAADPRRRGARRELDLLRRAGVPDPRPRADRGAPERRMARRSSPTRTPCGSRGR